MVSTEVVPLAVRIRELLKQLESLLPPPEGHHHSLTFGRYGNEVNGFSDVLILHLWNRSPLMGAADALTLIVDDGDFEKPPVDLLANIIGEAVKMGWRL